MKTITFFANMPSFIIPIANYFDEKEDWVVRFFVSGTQDEFNTCLQTSDVLWFEWCNEMLLAAQHLMKVKTSKVICRLHSYEVFTQMPGQVDWSKVDHLVFVNESVKNIMKMMGGDKVLTSNVNQIVIPNLINHENWKFADIKEKKNKIASLGHLNYKKDSSMLLPISEALTQDFPKHKIHVAGEFQDMRYKLLFEQYRRAVDSAENMVFDGFQKNVAGWLEDKKYVLNTSLFESFNYAIAEGMLCGALPLVRNWYGSDFVWPDIERWNTLGDFVSLLNKYENMGQDETIELQKKNRQFVIDNYGFDKVIPRIEEIIVS